MVIGHPDGGHSSIVFPQDSTQSSLEVRHWLGDLTDGCRSGPPYPAVIGPNASATIADGKDDLMNGLWQSIAIIAAAAALLIGLGSNQTGAN